MRIIKRTKQMQQKKINRIFQQHIQINGIISRLFTFHVFFSMQFFFLLNLNFINIHIFWIGRLCKVDEKEKKHHYENIKKRFRINCKIEKKRKKNALWTYIFYAMPSNVLEIERVLGVFSHMQIRNTSKCVRSFFFFWYSMSFAHQMISCVQFAFIAYSQPKSTQ